MAKSNAERQKKWRDANRALFNLRRRNLRKNLRGDAESTVCTGQPERENDRPTVPDAVGEIPTPATISVEKKEIGGFKLNMISLPPETVQDEPMMSVAKPKVLRDDFGNQLTEAQWNRWQEIKRKAEEKGYVKDEYSQ